MKSIIVHIIRARNPRFTIDPALNSFAFYQFILVQASALIRGFKLLIYFKKPSFVLLGRNVKFFNLPKIRFGKFVKIGDNVYISALGKNGVSIGNNVGLGANSQIVLSTSLSHLGESIKIGNNVGIGEFAYLGGAGGLVIGDDCIIGQALSCHPENHNFNDLDLPYRYQGVTRKGIKIGKNCWIGSKVTILDGVEIGNNCIIAAGSVVNKSFPENSVIGGVPAKILKEIHQHIKLHTPCY